MMTNDDCSGGQLALLTSKTEVTKTPDKTQGKKRQT